ncbi:MAG: hypothetical protein Q7S96_03750 [bacterium]|nr:hypothetical protein [bacterium]
MGRLFSMFRNIWRGVVSMMITDAAIAFPEETYRGQIQKAREMHEKLLRAAGMVKGNLISQQRVLDEIERELAETDAKLKVAVQRAVGGDTSMKEVGALLTRKKEGLVKRRDEQRPTVSGLQQSAEQVKRDLRKSEASIKDLTQRMQTNIARLRSAQQREQMQNLLSGLSVEGDDQAIAELEAAIDQQVGRVELVDEIAGGSIERQLEDLEAQSGDAVAASEFDRLVAEMQRQQGVAEAASALPDPGGKAV